MMDKKPVVILQGLPHAVILQKFVLGKIQLTETEVKRLLTAYFQDQSDLSQAFASLYEAASDVLCAQFSRMGNFDKAITGLQSSYADATPSFTLESKTTYNEVLHLVLASAAGGR